jgi:CBS domain containing-hemolysin-like protein
MLRTAFQIGERATDLLYEIDEEDEGDGEDGYQEEEIQLISSVLEFTDAVVREVMIPRTDMVVIAADADSDRALDLVIAEGRSRIPVTGESMDDIVGVLYARDLLELFDSGSGTATVASLMRRAHFVPETKRVSELLRELQENQIHLAVVVDEFGGTAGLVTIEDLIEELVGEIVDEYDVEEPMVSPLSGGGYLVDARLPIDDLAKLIGTDLPDEDWDTLGGLLLGLAGRVPREGESFDIGDVSLVAERVQGRRVARVRIRPR